LKLAILSNVSTQFLTQNLSVLLKKKYEVEVLETSFGSWKICSRGLDPTLNDFEPDSMLLFLSSTAVSPDRLSNGQFLEEVKQSIVSITEWFSGKLYITGIDYPESACLDTSLKLTIDHINRELFLLRQQEKYIFVDLFDLFFFEKAETFLPRKYHGLGIFSFHPKYYEAISQRISNIIDATISRPIKTIFVDLDNTLWPGILGDEGIKGINLAPDSAALPHLDLQYLLKKLKQSGVILNIASKNDIDIVKEFFNVRREELLLHWEDFATIKANWEPKSANINEALAELNLTHSGVVFIDDSKFEQNEVSSALPEIIVLKMPDEPYEWNKYLVDSNLFHTPVVTGEDVIRTQFYQYEGKRLASSKSMSRTDYLQSLQLVLRAQPVSSENIDRAIQLLNKTNQFNIKGAQIDYEEVKRFTADESSFFWLFTLQDIYSNYGIVSCVYGTEYGEHTLEIEGWCLSCRAFTRNVENSILQFLCTNYPQCKAMSIAFNATSKNKYAKNYFVHNSFKKTSFQEPIVKFTKASNIIINETTYITQEIDENQ
tara:strand:- start:146 stop:1777 length:1632 start_codon:yes stop_codon:yes gene_type:complete